jgi:hypothetical protein
MCTVPLPPGGYPIAVNIYIVSYTKVKEVNVIPVHATKTCRGSTDPLILNLGTKRRFWEVNFNPRDETRIPFELEAVWAPEPV